MPSFLTSVLAGIAIASSADYKLDAYPVDLAPAVPFITDVRLTDNTVEDFLPISSVNPFN